MDLDEDKETFYDNLVEQLNLYFEKWEGELDLTPEEPPELGAPGGLPPALEPEPEISPFSAEEEL